MRCQTKRSRLLIGATSVRTRCEKHRRTSGLKSAGGPSARLEFYSGRREQERRERGEPTRRRDQLKPTRPKVNDRELTSDPKTNKIRREKEMKQDLDMQRVKVK